MAMRPEFRWPTTTHWKAAAAMTCWLVDLATTRSKAGQGIDILLGGAGNDVLDGEQGNDQVIGGDGDDTYIYRPGSAADTFNSFVAGLNTDDHVDISAFTSITSFAQVLSLATQVGEDTVIDFGGGDVLTLANVLKNSLAEEDFVLANAPPVTPPVHWIGSVDVGSHPPGYTVAGTGDFNGDGTNDVLWFNAGNGDTEVWKTANGQWAGSVDIGHHPLGYAVAGVGDFNNDGTDDVLWYNQTTTDTEIWKISNGGWAGSVDIGSHPAGWKPAGIGDFDHNGSSDVLWFNQSTGNTEIWKLVNGQWAGSVDIGNHPAGYTVAGVGDFNADGTDDVLWFNAATGDAEIWKIIERPVGGQRRYRAASAGLDGRRRRRLQSRRHRRCAVVRTPQRAQPTSGRSMTATGRAARPSARIRSAGPRSASAISITTRSPISPGSRTAPATSSSGCWHSVPAALMTGRPHYRPAFFMCTPVCYWLMFPSHRLAGWIIRL